MNINPYHFAFMGVAFSIGFCVLGAAWYELCPFPLLL
jgi:hypothetical protein